jgi:PKD repeat protein
MNTFSNSNAVSWLVKALSAPQRLGVWSVALVFLIALPLNVEAASNKKPKANPGKAQIVNEQTPVTLDGRASSDADGTISTYLWEQTSGPAVTLNGVSTSQATFNAPLAKKAVKLSFKLTVTDNLGATASKPVKVTVKPVNTAPVANAGSDQHVTFGATVTLTASGSHDTDTDNQGLIVKYLWKQTKGTKVKLSSSSVAAPTFTAPATAQQLSFTVTVTDDEKASGVSAPVNVFVAATPPLAVSLDLDKLSLAKSDTLTATAHASDGKAPYSYSIDWGDSSPKATTANAAHSYTATGSYSVTLKVTDADLNTKTTNAQTVTVIPDLTATLVLEKSTLGKSDTLKATPSATGGKADYSYSIDWGDGTIEAASANATHKYSTTGSYNVTLTVTDADSKTNTSPLQTVTVAPDVTAFFELVGTTPSILAGDTLTAKASAIAGGIGGPYTVKFDWGDGTVDSFPLATGVDNKAASHPYNTVGSYQLTITVTDTANITKTYNITVDVQAVNPLGQC